MKAENHSPPKRPKIQIDETVILLGVLYRCKALASRITCNHQLAAKLLCNITRLFRDQINILLVNMQSVTTN